MSKSEHSTSTPIPTRHSGTRLLKQSARISIVLIVVIAWGWFLVEQIDTLQGYEWHFAPLSLFVGIFFAALYFGGLAFGWTLLLVHVGQKPMVVPLRKGIYVWLLSMVTRYVPGNIWHILSRVAFANYLQVSRTRIITSATIEQILTLLGALVIVVLTLPSWSQFLENTQISSTITILLLPLGILGMHPYFFGALLKWISIQIKRPDLAWDYEYSTLLRILSVFTITNTLAGVSLTAIISGMTSVQLTHLPLIMGSAALAWIIGYLSFLTPSGLGVREGVLTALLAQVYPLPVAIIASLLFRVVSTLGELLAVFATWLHSKLQPPDIPQTSKSL